MRSFIIACGVAITLAMGAAAVLNSFVGKYVRGYSPSLAQRVGV